MGFSSSGKNHGGGHGLCFLSSADGVEWVKEFETGPNEWCPSEDADRSGESPKFLPTRDRLYVMFNYDRKGRDLADGQKEALAIRWRELGGSEQSFGRWVGHHGTTFQAGLAWTEDGHTFCEPRPLLEPGWRVWRPHTFAGRHYMIGYCCHGQALSFSPEAVSWNPFRVSEPRRGE